MDNLVKIHRLKENETVFKIVPLKVKRSWMSESNSKFAYNCLPLNIANQYGWAVLSPVDFTVIWESGKRPEDVTINIHEAGFDRRIMSYFGESVFTLHLDFIVQTPESYSTYIRGVPNDGKPGIKPLDAIVETDWLPFTFTYNFLIETPGIYEFKKDEPLFSFFPVERGSVENFELEESYIEEAPELLEDFEAFKEHSMTRGSDTFFHRLYLKGMSPQKKFDIKNHTAKLNFGEIKNKSDE